MTNKILVAYDTIHGSTAELARFLGKEFGKAGNTVEVHRVTDIADVSTYQAVVVGSPVNRENWTDAARDFLRRNRQALSQRPVAMYFACLATLRRTPEDGLGRVINSYVTPLLSEFPELKPVSIGIFAGVLDYTTYTEDVAAGIRRFIVARGGPAEGRHDYRDWRAISNWVEDVCTKLENSAGAWSVTATGQR